MWLFKPASLCDYVPFLGRSEARDSENLMIIGFMFREGSENRVA
jgi:hypothetical protein